MGLRASLLCDGDAAVAATREQAFDLVLIDLHLPLFDGLAAIRIIQSVADTARSTVPIVAPTADACEETQDRCMVAGMNGFLSKPMKPEMLTTTLRRFFGPLAPWPPWPPCTSADAQQHAVAAGSAGCRLVPRLDRCGTAR